MGREPPSWAVRTAADAEALRQGCYWDEGKARAIVRFSEVFFRSQYIPGKFKLLEWQSRLLQSLKAWRMPDGSPRFRLASLHCSKKNGKTLLTSILALYELYASEQPSPFAVVAAASRENASQVFAELRYAVEHGPLADTAVCTPYTKRIEVADLNGKLWTLAADGKRVHGYNCSLVVLDECHAIKDPELYRALRYACIARKGLMVLISTAGNDPGHWYHAFYLKAKRIVSGEDLDISHYAEVHESDPEADPEDPEQWHRACPSLGISYSVEDFKRELYAAKNSSVADWLIFQQLMLNRWVRPSETAWLDVTDFAKHQVEMDEDRLAQCPAWIGLDLSETVCPSSASTVWDLGDGSYYIRSRGWVTRNGIELRQRTQLPKFAEFSPDLEVIEGDLLDKDAILEHVKEQGRKYDVRGVNFDPRGAYILAHQIEREGFTTGRYQQSARNFDAPMRSFEAAYKAGKVLHDGNKWLRYCLGNVRLTVNRFGEIAPIAARSVDYIDGAVAALLAYHSAACPPADDTITTGMGWV